MICDTCYGNGFTTMADGQSRVIGYEPCPECGGCGVSHCCDGDAPSPRDELVGQARPATRKANEEEKGADMTDTSKEAVERLAWTIACETNRLSWDFRGKPQTGNRTSDTLLTLLRERDEARARVAAAYEEVVSITNSCIYHDSAGTGFDEATFEDKIDDLATGPVRDALAERDARIRAEEREEIRHMLGAMILAVEEDCEEDHPDYSVWFNHWMTRGAPTDDPHCGDCTNVPMTCHRWLWDRVFAQVDKSLAAIRARSEDEV